MYTTEIATRLIAAITPDNDRSGFAAPLGDEYILIRDTQAGAYVVTADDAARFLADDDTGYDSFCWHCDPVQDEAAAFFAWGEYDVHVDNGMTYILDDAIRSALDAGKIVWEVKSADGQAHIGYYAGDDADDAIRAALDDAGSDDDPSLYRAIRMAG